MQDLLAATIELLKMDADLASLVAGRIYGEEIPEDRRKAWPGCGRCIQCQQEAER